MKNKVLFILIALLVSTSSVLSQSKIDYSTDGATKYGISGVWKNKNNVITHYAIHTVGEKGISKASKTSKASAIKLLKTSGNTAVTLIWNYSTGSWSIGGNIEVNGAYLKSKTDNIDNLLDYDWITW